MELLIALLVVVLTAAFFYVVIRSRRSPDTTTMAGSPPRSVDGIAEVTLAIDDGDPDSPAVRRLASDAAHHVLSADQQATTVVVRARNGKVLGRFERAAAATPFVDVPALHEPHAPRHSGPGDVTRRPERVLGSGDVRFAEPLPRPHAPLADRFELPAAVRARVENLEDPVAIVRAILDESEVPVDADGNVFRRGDRVLIVLRTPAHAAADAEALNAAFLRFERSGARAGVVLTAGMLHLLDVRRREALAPSLVHVGPTGIQRMADAVALHADPFDFVVDAA